MWLLLSGEGPSDIGTCVNAVDQCESADFKPGPMARIADHFVDAELGFSPIDTELTHFIHKSYLSQLGKGIRTKKSPALPGLRRPKETQYFERNARALARVAKQLAREKDDAVIAVLFRDSDGTHSSARGLWQDKRDSMVRGFEKENFGSGVPMVPKPKSEAWLLCAVKTNPYQNCAKLEDESGNDRAANSLKRQLENAVGRHLGATAWADKVHSGEVDLEAIDMPSFNDFRQTFTRVLRNS